MYFSESLFTILKTSEAIVCIRLTCKGTEFDTIKSVFNDYVKSLFINLRDLFPILSILHVLAALQTYQAMGQ